MNSKAVKSQILHGSIARRFVLRTFLLVSGISLIPLLHILHDNDLGMLSSVASCDCVPILGFSQSNGSSLFNGGHPLFPFMDSFTPVQCEEHVNLTVKVAKELIGKKLLNYTDKALCVGEGSFSAASAMRELGIVNAVGVDGRHFFSLRQKQFVYELDFKDNSLDFVFFRNLDKLSGLAFLVIEIERILRPGGVGAVIVGTSSSKPNSLIRSASPVSSVLKSSNIVHVGNVNSHILVVFEKKSKKFYFEQYPMPDQCPSISANRPFIPQMEPLVKQKPIEFEKTVSTLPKFFDVSSSKRPVYIDIGMGKSLDSNALNEVLHFYPLDVNAFNIYFVDHNTSIMLSYISKPGITFVYHPNLAGNRVKAADSSDDGDGDGDGEDIDPSLEIEEGFNFLEWFRETVEYADFVVLKMNAKEMELKFLSELFESGVICWVDELFLGCSDGVEEEGGLRGNCMDLFQSLRKSGVFVHQWWDDDSRSSW